MKSHIFILLSTMLLLVSCAEKGPYTMGSFDYDFQVSQVTCRTAIITVTSGDNNKINKNSVSSLHLYDKENSYSVDYGTEFEGNYSNDKTKKFIFNYLHPNSTYSILATGEIYINGNEEEDFRSTEFDTGKSFTTPSEGDFSAIGEMKCELIGYNYEGSENIAIKFIFPSQLEYYRGRFYASLSPVMSDPIESTYIRYSDNDDSTIEAVFPLLEKKTYYFEYVGDMRYYFNNNYEYETLEDINLKAQNSIDLSN